ncbi:MAG: hypothetical protein QOE36_1130 [Gaiellaceae bacterium]|nr:hypothetical protein [Gaiellaceae bacterium]
MSSRRRVPALRRASGCKPRLCARRMHYDFDESSTTTSQLPHPPFSPAAGGVLPKEEEHMSLVEKVKPISAVTRDFPPARR